MTLSRNLFPDRLSRNDQIEMEKQEAAHVWVRTSLHTGATTDFHQSPLEECARNCRQRCAGKQTFLDNP